MTKYMKNNHHNPPKFSTQAPSDKNILKSLSSLFYIFSVISDLFPLERIQCTSFASLLTLWEYHPFLVSIANPSRLQESSLRAQEWTNLGLHYSQAIDYFPLSLPAASWPLFRSHYGHTSSRSQPKWTLQSIIILHLSRFLTSCVCTDLSDEKEDTVSDVTSTIY